VVWRGFDDVGDDLGWDGFGAGLAGIIAFNEVDRGDEGGRPSAGSNLEEGGRLSFSRGLRNIGNGPHIYCHNGLGMKLQVKAGEGTSEIPFGDRHHQSERRQAFAAPRSTRVHVAPSN
jgi:hypothetical protein